MEIVEFVHFVFDLCYSVYIAFYHIIIYVEASRKFLCGFVTDIAEFVQFGSDLCYSFYIALYHIIISFVATGLFLCDFLCHGLNGVTAALDYVPTCTDNNCVCTLKALLVFVLELGKSFDSFGVKTKPYQILICLAIILIPFLREIVATCLSFIISLIFAILIKLFNLSHNRRVRRTFIGNSNGPLQWSDVFKSFKQLFTRFKLSKSARSPQNAKTDNSFKEPALTCLICYENPKCVLLLPCKHACLCVECTNSLMKWQRQRLCPLCRKAVTSSMQIYI